MKKRVSRAVMTLLMLCAVLSAFWIRAQTAERVSPIPVERVFARVTPTQPPAGYRSQRDEQRKAEMTALAALTETDAAAGDMLQTLIARSECESAVEEALAAMGHEGAVCALRRGAAAVCVRGRLTAAEAQRVAELCAKMVELDPENVFILDECANL